MANIENDQPIATGTVSTLLPPRPPYKAFRSIKLHSIRVQMPDGKVLQWKIIERPRDSGDCVLHKEMDMADGDAKSPEFNLIRGVIRRETKNQLGDRIYTVKWRNVNRRVVDYVLAKARVEFPVLLRFENEWASEEIMRRVLAHARADRDRRGYLNKT
ncbi:unnamed protein product [Rhizoctonia solani]|uniref:Uncharacterized protein n=1 Tax=Rhizoctonia solani TaxID=456999 RepID=A0A8H3DYA9_9AGAM|nr:unnamed protein product [Rhizoctonia solani]